LDKAIDPNATAMLQSQSTYLQFRNIRIIFDQTVFTLLPLGAGKDNISADQEVSRQIALQTPEEENKANSRDKRNQSN
jgi:hypothetical protein